MAQIDIASIVVNSVIANLAIHPQIKRVLHDDMSLDDFVDTMKLWVSTNDFWRHMAEGFLKFINYNLCKDCNKLVPHNEDVEAWKKWSCGCKTKVNHKRGKPRQVSSLRRSK